MRAPSRNWGRALEDTPVGNCKDPRRTNTRDLLRWFPSGLFFENRPLVREDAQQHLLQRRWKTVNPNPHASASLTIDSG